MAEKTHSDGAKGAHDVHTSTGDHGGGHSSTFPPFNSETFAPQLVWLFLTFTLLYVLMSRLVLPRIGEVIEERRDRIQRDLDTAERLKGDTDKALADYEKALSDARTNAGSIARETREKLDVKVAERQAVVDAEIDGRIAEAEKQIAETRAKAQASVSDIASDVAGAIVKQLIDTDVSSADVKAAIASQANS
ncbi:MAG: F0F1 ATP synthase subunit B [Alphaproteobacteria bacterium]|nr:F0F1 ATP synthase subunit B [Alphaproteobacteria bacterium]